MTYDITSLDSWVDNLYHLCNIHYCTNIIVYDVRLVRIDVDFSLVFFFDVFDALFTHYSVSTGQDENQTIAKNGENMHEKY